MPLTFALPHTDTLDGPLPLARGLHSWLWKLETVRDWPSVIARHKALGFVGAHAHGNGDLLRRVLSPDLRRRFEDAGLTLGASLAFDTGTTTKGPDGQPVAFAPTPREKLLNQVLRAVDALGAPCTVGLNWEMRWERTSWHPHRKADAAWIADELTRRLTGTGVMLWDAPWWKPGVHGTAPTDEFGRAMAFRVPQTYFVYSEKGVDKLIPVPASFKAKYPRLPQTPAAYMVQTARDQYATRTVKRPMAWGFQGTAGAGADAKVGQCLRDYPVTFWWHFLRLEEPGNHPTRAVLRTAALIDRGGDPAMTFRSRVEAFQREAGLSPDGWVGPATVARARTRFAADMAGY